MERARGNNLALTTRDLRLIARNAHRRGLNRQLLPAQFKLLDPKGTHILTPNFLHDKADGKPVEEHVRFHAHIKLIGKQKAVERLLDVSMEFVKELYTDEEWDDLREKSIAIRSIQDDPIPNPLADASAEGNA